jgi:hypothetical protein
MLFLAVVAVLVCTGDALHELLHQCDSRRNIVVTFSPGMGYRNQMDTISKAMFIGTLTNRSICLPYFSSDYRQPADISPQHFIDLKATNDNLAAVPAALTLRTQSQQRSPAPTLVMTTNDAAKRKCICLLLQGEGAPAGMRRCAYGSRGTTKMIRDMDANYTNMLDFIRRPDIHHLDSLCLSPGMPYFEPIRHEHDAHFRKVQASLVHHSVMTSIANYVKTREGVCKDRCTGEELYISTHPRLENDFISQLQMLTGFYQKRGINGAFNNAIIDRFLHDYQKFLDQFSIVVDTIHISTGLGKSEEHLNNFLIKNYYEKRYRAVSSYHYEYLEHITQVAHFTNHSSHFDTDIPDIPDPHNVSHHISKSELITFHHILSGINGKKSKLRDLHAVIDFMIASQAGFFYGVCASSFTAALMNFVDISGCFQEDSQHLKNLTKSDFGRLTKKIDTLRKNSSLFFEEYKPIGSNDYYHYD